MIQDLEKNIFSNLTVHISFYYRYVDDIVLAAPKDEINNILDSFNAYHERIKFTVDHGDEFGVNFLDVKLSARVAALYLTCTKSRQIQEGFSVFSPITLSHIKKASWLG